MLMPVKIFFCYAHEDEQLLNKLKSQLIPLQRQGWSPAVGRLETSACQCTASLPTTPGDHKGPSIHPSPPSPLRNPEVGLRLMLIRWTQASHWWSNSQKLAFSNLLLVHFV